MEIDVLFVVIDVLASYNAILGRPTHPHSQNFAFYDTPKYEVSYLILSSRIARKPRIARMCYLGFLKRIICRRAKDVLPLTS